MQKQHDAFLHVKNQQAIDCDIKRTQKLTLGGGACIYVHKVCL